MGGLSTRVQSKLWDVVWGEGRGQSHASHAHSSARSARERRGSPGVIISGVMPASLDCTRRALERNMGRGMGGGMGGGMGRGVGRTGQRRVAAPGRFVRTLASSGAPIPPPPTQPSSLRLPLGLHSGRKGCSGRSVGAVGALGARPASTCGARPTERSAATLVTILVMRQETVLVMTPLTRLHWSAGSMGTTLPMTLVTAPVMAPSARSWESGAWVVKGSGVGGLGASIRGVS